MLKHFLTKNKHILTKSRLSHSTLISRISIKSFSTSKYSSIYDAEDQIIDLDKIDQKENYAG
jgi:hypothetical protein